MARPTKKPRTNQLRIRLNDEELAMLNDYCIENHVTKTEVVVRGIRVVTNNGVDKDNMQNAP